MIEVEATVALLAAMSDRQHRAALTILVGELDRRAEEITELGNKDVAASRRIAELESGEVRIQWGVRYREDDVDNWYEAEAEARAVAADPTDSGVAVSREIRTGPWTDAAAHLDAPPVSGEAP